MIEMLHLSGLGVIAQAELPLGPGFTAITGETGAGKTMVVTGLGLLLGRRSDASVVRSGATQASVDGVWAIPTDGLIADKVRDAGGTLEAVGDNESELFLGRTVSAEGRSRATVGGRLVPAGLLAELADSLVVVHGQSDQLRLRSTAAQRDALDRYAGEPVTTALAAYRAAYDRHRVLRDERDSIVAARETRAREAEDLRIALGAIAAVAPQPGEDLELAAKAERLLHVEELRAASDYAHRVLSSDGDDTDVTGMVADARRSVEKAAANDPNLAPIAEQLADLGYRATETAGALARYLADLDTAGPQELQAVEDRRAELAALIRQHGSLEAAIALDESGALRLAELDDDDQRVERLSAEVDAAEAERDARADALTQARAAAAQRLGAAVTDELHALAMPDAHLEVELSRTEPTTSGCDEVALLLAPHSGATLLPVAKGASGGELSRVMLAIEVVLAATDPVPTLVFDEVDAGIGGAAATEVGRRLAQLADTAQVIVVTHLAQVAAFATNHLTVVKSDDGSVTESSVRRLEGFARESEMARLLSGSPDSSTALAHARELLDRATHASPRPAE